MFPRNVISIKLLANSFLIAASVASSAVFAQGALEEIIVTAQKREQSLQDVPASVTALFPDSVRDFHGSGENIRALTGRVPGLIVESSNGRQSPRFYIRGLGNTDFDVNANQPVSMVYDDIPLENSILKSLPVFDIERIEVLNGPQGTLFGRNTTAGIVKIDSVKPSFEKDGYIQGGYGERNTHNWEAALGGGLTDTLAGRVSLKYLSRGDWINNPSLAGSGDDHGAFDEFTYRVQLLWEPNEDFSSTLKLHGFHQDGDVLAFFYANAIEVGSKGVRPGFDPETATWDSEPRGEVDHFGVNLNMEYDISDTMTVTSITGYDEVEGFTGGDVDGGIVGGPAQIGQLGFNAFFGLETADGLSDHYQLSQELRLSGTVDRWFYQLGFYYFDEDITVDSENFAVGGARTDITQVVQQTTSVAGFGHLEFEVSDALTVSAGVRYTDDEKDLEVVPGPGSFAPAATIALSDDYVNWDVSGTYAFADNFSVYARIGTSSRGPVTIGRFGFTDTADTEDIISYEGGFKALLFDGRVRWNASAFYYEIDDQQLTATGGADIVNSILNADKTEGAGFESVLEILFHENFRVNMNMSYTDTEIKDGTLGDEQCASTPRCTGLDPVTAVNPGFFGPVTTVAIDGNPLPRAPKWLFNFDVFYGIPFKSGRLYASTDWNYRGDSNIFFHESVEFVADSRWIGGVRAGFKGPNDKYDIAFVGRNITDEIAVDGALNFLNLTAFVNEPSWFGFEARYNFW